MNRLTRIGLAITAVWVAAFAMIVYFNLEDVRRLTPNEWGDFLSGATAPLALMWLVIGYFLQQEELRLNTAALKAQEEELRRQVAETAALVANADRQAKAAEELAHATNAEREAAIQQQRLAALPAFRARTGSANGANYKTIVINRGGTVSGLSVSTDDADISIDVKPKDLWEPGQEGVLQCHTVRFPFKFMVSFTDSLKIKHTLLFEMTEPHRFRELSDS